MERYTRRARRRRKGLLSHIYAGRQAAGADHASCLRFSPRLLGPLRGALGCATLSLASPRGGAAKIFPPLPRPAPSPASPQRNPFFFSSFVSIRARRADEEEEEERVTRGWVSCTRAPGEQTP